MLKDYNRLVENPEWKKRRGHGGPAHETILLTNRPARQPNERIIFLLPESTEIRDVRVSNCNLEANVFDYNTVWNGGKEPIRTGMKGYRAVGAPDRSHPESGIPRPRRNSSSKTRTRRRPRAGTGTTSSTRT